MGSRSHEDANEANWNPETHAFATRIGKVIRVNEDDHTIDAVLTGGGVVFKATILEMWAGTDHGDKWTPQFTPDPGVSDLGLPAEAWQLAPQQQRDVYCLLAFANGRLNNPFVLGFFYPEISQMMVPGFQRLTRHVGDSFSAVNKNGDVYPAFDQSGAFLGLHDAGNARPPDVTQADYDRRAFTARPKKSWTMRTANGVSVSLDGESGNLRHSAPGHIENDAGGDNDIYGNPVVVRGLEDLYLAEGPLLRAGQCLAPWSEDATQTALNLVVNAAYDRRLTQREGAGSPDRVAAFSTGWRFLGDGDAGRMEFGPDGRQRFFSARDGRRDGAITWVRPEPDYINHFVDFHFPVPGTNAFVCPPNRFAITGIEVAGTSNYTITGGSGAGTVDSPRILNRGDVLRIEVLAVDNPLLGAQISLWGNRG